MVLVCMSGSGEGGEVWSGELGPAAPGRPRETHREETQRPCQAATRKPRIGARVPAGANRAVMQRTTSPCPKRCWWLGTRHLQFSCWRRCLPRILHQAGRGQQGKWCRCIQKFERATKRQRAGFGVFGRTRALALHGAASARRQLWAQPRPQRMRAWLPATALSCFQPVPSLLPDRCHFLCWARCASSEVMRSRTGFGSCTTDPVSSRTVLGWPPSIERMPV
jgi:hypothetical protein